MKEIPKYIIKNIEQITRYAERMEPLIGKVKAWYDNNMAEYGEDAVPDDEFFSISSNERGLKEFSIESIKENFRIAEKTRKTASKKS